jgi:hypothetical protein
MNDEAMIIYANTFCEDVTNRDDCEDCDRCLRLSDIKHYSMQIGGELSIRLYCEKNLMTMCAEKKKKEECKKLYQALDKFAELYGNDSLKKEFETYINTKDYI